MFQKSCRRWIPAIGALAGLPYAQAAAKVVLPFVGGEYGASELGAMAQETYAGFRHPATAPLTQIDDNLYVLELFHGPTLAFKDFAMQWLGRLMNHALQKRGARATIVGATSGDTGAAAIEAYGGQSQTDTFILYPHGRVSDVQRRQMTTVDRPNVQRLSGGEGNFDDCQAILKGTLFNNLAFRDGYEAVGQSIRSTGRASSRRSSIILRAATVSPALPGIGASPFTVWTGNFGDIYRRSIAPRRMGLPIRTVWSIATNENDILTRCV